RIRSINAPFRRGSLIPSGATGGITTAAATGTAATGLIVVVRAVSRAAAAFLFVIAAGGELLDLLLVEQGLDLLFGAALEVAAFGAQPAHRAALAEEAAAALAVVVVAVVVIVVPAAAVATTSHHVGDREGHLRLFLSLFHVPLHGLQVT